MTLSSKDDVSVTIDDVRTTARNGEGAHSPPITLALSRLAGLDALRGLMLTIVLADHCGDVLTQGRFIRQWTLMGLGWSDAAEAFVFLSGFTFGWVYSARLQRHGVWHALRQGAFRTLQLYLAYLATVTGVAILQLIQEGNDWRLSVAHMDACSMGALLLCYQPYATGILCLYVVCLPFTLVTFVAFRRDKWWLLLLISYGSYSLVQIFPTLNLRTENGYWFFNPFAWQLLMVGGAMLGRESRYGHARQLPTTALRTIAITMACVVVAISLVSQKGWVLVSAQSMEWVQSVSGYSQWQYELLGKTVLSPLRLLHFAALAYLLSVFAPLRRACWSHASLVPLRACGRHSLKTYCIGILLTHGLSSVPITFSSTPLRAAVLTALVLATQFVVAVLFDFCSAETKRG